MSLSYTPRLSRRANALAIVGLIVVLVVLVAAVIDAESHQQDAQRQVTARHWAEAGLHNPVTTLKDGGNKVTVGTMETCTVSVEGFTTYTTVTVKSNQGSPGLRQELTFLPVDGQVNPDQAAFNYMKNKLLNELKAYCTTG